MHFPRPENTFWSCLKHWFSKESQLLSRSCRKNITWLSYEKWQLKIRTGKMLLGLRRWPVVNAILISIFISIPRSITPGKKGYNVRLSATFYLPNFLKNSSFHQLGITFQKSPRSSFFVLVPLLLQHKHESEDENGEHDFHSVKLPPKVNTIIDFHVDVNSNIFWKLVKWNTKLNFFELMF